ncbi:MAG TPA: hypothetical protein VGM69_27975 [Chloroflexota bacterium]|jgi:hypothetical protein
MPERSHSPGLGRDRAAVAHALATWRRAEELLAEPMFDRDRGRYEAAVAALVVELEPFGSVAELVESYGQGDEWAHLAAAACVGASARGGEELMPAVVADVAFWRRCRGMVAAALAG